MKILSNRSIILLINIILLSLRLSAQGVDDLGVVWVKDYGVGNIVNIKSNTSGGYTGCGEAWNSTTPAGVSRLDGLIVEFNESGEEIRKAKIRIPQSYINSHDITRATAYFNIAFKTNDGGFLAFGYLYNPNAPISEKQPDWGALGHINNPLLTNGVWIVKLDHNLNVVRNELVRGLFLSDGWQSSDGGIVVAGFDASTGGVGGITLLRKYNQSGVLLKDARASYREISSIYKFPHNNSFVALTPDRYLRINENLNITAYSLNSILGTHAPYPWAYSITPSKDGGVFISSRLASNSNQLINYNNGDGIFKLNSSNSLLYYKISKPAKTTFYAPLLLSDASNSPKYVGVARTCDAGFTNCKNNIYELTDNGSFTHRIGGLYPNGTFLKAVSVSDGFFSCGQNEGKATIAKLSTCAKFKAINANDIYVSYEPSVNISQTINYTGAKGASKGNIKYSLQTKVLKGTVNGKTAGGILESYTASVASYTISAGVASGKVLDFNRTYTLNPNESHAEIEVLLTLEDSYATSGISQQCRQTSVFKIIVSKPSSTLFSDDVWFFGLNENIPQGNPGNILGTDKTSKGIIFKKDNGGGYKAYDYSKISKVNSWENSLSVSTPACEGSFIFYTQHDKVYNSKHEPMKGGIFQGHTSIADGLAAAYLGNNKYILISVSNAVWGNLNYYIIDMNKENGLGEMFPGGVIDNTGHVSEGIELMPMLGTYNQYWLAYYNRKSNDVKIVKIDGTNPNSPIITNHMALSMNNYIKNSMIGNNGIIYSFKANNSYSALAMAHPFVDQGITLADDRVKLFKFNPLNGILAFDKQFSSSLNGDLYSFAFSQNGKFLYTGIAGLGNGSCDGYVLQYNLEASKIEGYRVYQTKSPTIGYSGGGLKMGPDGKIYIMRQNSDYMAVIPNPDLSFNAGGKLIVDGFKLSVKGAGLGISTGLTPPWVNPPSANHPPVANKDYATSHYYQPVVIEPLENDTDPNNHTLNLNNVSFADPADAVKGSITWSAITNKVTFTPNKNYCFTEGEKLLLRYIVKNDGIPVSMCDEGEIEITINSANPKLNHPDIRLQISPIPHRTINLSSYLDTVGISSVQWESLNNDPPITSDGNISTSNFKYPHIYRYRCKLTGQCGASNATLYIKAVEDKILWEVSKTIVCCHEIADNLQLQQIFGLEALKNGANFQNALTYNTANVATCIKTAQQVKFKDAVIFNGKKAYVNGIGETIIYKGDATARKIVIAYKSDASSSLGVQEYKLTIILTKNFML